MQHTTSPTHASNGVTITIERIEGPRGDLTKLAFTTWTAATARIREIGTTVEAGDGGSRDKVAVDVTWPDGESWGTTFGVDAAGGIDGRTCDLGTSILGRLLVSAGRNRPRHLTRQQYRAWVNQSEWFPAIDAFITGRTFTDDQAPVELPPLDWDLTPAFAVDTFRQGSFYSPPLGARLVSITGPSWQRFGTVIGIDSHVIRGCTETQQVVAWDDGTVSNRDRARLWSSGIQSIGVYWDEFQPAADAAEIAGLVAQHQAREAAVAKEQEERDQAMRERVARGKEIADRLIPADTKFLMVAELRTDASDAHSDYSAHKVLERVVLATSAHGRDLFPEMRKAAARFPDTKHLAEAGIEHREKWSMGSGYFLSEHSDSRSGWVIRKERLFGNAWRFALHESLGQRHAL